MAYMKLIVTFTLVTLCSSSTLPTSRHVDLDDFDPNPQYTYSYDVHDSLTGDSKGQVEARSGDVVLGQYSLNDPDGMRRTVDYTSDPVNGFNAVVRRSPIINGLTLVEPKVTVATRRAPVMSSLESQPSYVAMPYHLAQFIFARSRLPESWISDMFPYFYFY